MPAHLTILGSGSNGNCSFLECGNSRILIDAGFSARQIRERLATIGRAPEGLSGILITHEHTDHTQGLGPLCGRTGTPVFCNRDTRDAIQRQFPEVPFNFRLFETRAEFDLGEFTIQSFDIPHDAVDPVGFVVHAAGVACGFVTDLGHVPRHISERLRHVQVLLLEANYDPRLLQEDTRRPWSTKQRIQGRHGHLSNDDAAATAREIATAGLRHLFLGHLSRDCNRPDLAHRAVTAALAETGASHIQVVTTSQETPSSALDLEALLGISAAPQPQ